jgi:hypothetical protein
MAHYDGVKSFSETDFCEDLKRIDVATLAMHGGHDKIVPYKGTALLSVKLAKRGGLKIYRGFLHVMLTAKSRRDQPGPLGRPSAKRVRPDRQVLTPMHEERC